MAADAALITVDAHVGAQVTTEKVWDYCAEYDIPRAFVLTWMDRELSSFERSMESLTELFGRQRGCAANANRKRERISRRDRSGFHEGAYVHARMVTASLPLKRFRDALTDDAEEAHEKLVEMIAEGDDEMMEEFFREGTIPIEDLIPGVRKAIVAEKIVSGADGFVRCTTSARASLLTFLADVFPHPDEHAQVGYKEPRGKGRTDRAQIRRLQPLSLFVFKTLADRVCRADQLFQGEERGAEERCDAFRISTAVAGALSAHQ